MRCAIAFPLLHCGRGGTRRDRGGWVRVGGRRDIAFARDIEDHQFRADRALLAQFAVDRDDGAGDRRRQLDGRLVGHDVDERVVLADHLAGLDVPGDNLGFGRALADIGQLDDVTRHLTARRCSAGSRNRRAHR